MKMTALEDTGMGPSMKCSRVDSLVGGSAWRTLTTEQWPKAEKQRFYLSTSGTVFVGSAQSRPLSETGASVFKMEGNCRQQELTGLPQGE